MKKIDFKLMLVGIIGVVASFLGFSFLSVPVFAIFSIIAVFSLFLVNLVAPYVVRLIFWVAVCLSAYLSCGASFSVFAALLFVLPALVAAETIRNTKDYAITLCAGTGAEVLSIILIDKLFLIPAGGGFKIYYSAYIDSLANGFKQFSDMMIQVYDEAEVSLMVNMLDQYFYVLKLLFPALIIIFSLGIIFFMLLISKKFIINIPVPGFSEICAPKAVAYAYLFCYISIYLITGETLGYVVSNVSLILSVILTVCGLSLLRFYTKRIPSKLLSGIIFLFLIPPALVFSQVLLIAGALDSVINFRKIIRVAKK